MFKLDILTPNGVVVKGLTCKEILVPTVRGEIDILEGHTHVLTKLSTGIVTAKDLEGKDWCFSVTHGTCKVLGDSVSILSMTSESAEKIDLDRAKDALDKAEKKLAEAIESDSELEKFRRKKARAEMRIKLAYTRGDSY